MSSQKRSSIRPRTRLPSPVPSPVPSTVPRNIPSVSPAPNSLGTLVKEGFAWGLGNAVAHRVFGSIWPSAAPATTVVPPVQLPTKTPEYQQCMQDFNDLAACKHLLDGK